jgi:hypothetical protein
MSMEDAVGSRLRNAVRGLGRKRRNDAVPRGLRARLVSYAQARRRAGAGWGRIARELGVSGSTLQRWCATPARPALRPVRVAGVAARGRAPERSERGLVVVTAAGHRVEGLGVGEVASLLRALA